MPSPIILNLYDFHEAHLAAHQLQLEGQAAEVLENGYGCLPSAGYGCRLLVFEPSEMDEDAGEIVVGAIGNAIDTVLRRLVLAICGITPVVLFFSMLANKPRVESEGLVFYLLLAFVLWLVGAVITVTAYEDFRAGRAFGRVLILVIAWCYSIGCVLSYVLAIAEWFVWS